MSTAGVADVYPGDVATPGSQPTGGVLFTVLTDGEPDALLRVTTQLRLGNVMPRSGSFATSPDGSVSMRFEVQGLSAASAELIRRKLLQVTSVYSAECEPVAAPAS